MKEKTLKDVIDNNGRWNWYGEGDMEEEDKMFDSFCTRMWLDYCDENNDPISAPGRLDRDEYVNKWYDYLKGRYRTRDET
tara:strand:- start:44 stop:283 length:240 start_codon:yes stop_codon:yes gene_type:complete